jgi:indole-3-glycerol phosphate synthase
MLLTEWDFEEEKRIAIEEALEDAEEKVKAAEAQAIAINAKNLKALDVDVEIISKATGLPIERINEL